VKTRAFIASATRINLAERKIAAKQGARPQAWQPDAWEVFDEVPEVKEAIWYLGNQFAKLRLFPGVIVEGVVVSAFDADSGVPSNVATAAEEELARLKSARGGQADILRKLDMNLEVVGECYIVGWHATTITTTDDKGVTSTVDIPEDWQVRSIDEVENKSGTYWVTDDPTDTSGKGREVTTEDTIIRVWLEHPRHQMLADSLMRALIVDGRTASALSQQVYAEALSRHGAGMLLLPIEASFGPDNETESEGGEEEKRDVFLEEFEASILDPITDNSSSAQVQPMVVRMMAELIEKVKFLAYGRTTDPEIFTRIEGCIARIARGLPLPVEKTMGHMQTTFANAAQIDEDEFEDYLGPRADILMDALLYAYYRPQLLDNPTTKPWADRLVIGYDPSALIAQPDPEESADYGVEKGLISGEAWRRAKNWTEDDAPDALELLVSAGLRRGILTADLTLALLRLMPEAPDIQIEALPAKQAVDAQGNPIDGQSQQDQQDQAPPASTLFDALGRVLALIAATEPAALPPGQAGEPPGSPPGRPTEGAPQGPGGASITAQGALGAGSPPRTRGRHRTDAGKRLAAIDRDLLVRLTVASSAAMERALEKIGNVLRTKASAHRAITRDVPRREVASVLGRTTVLAAAGDDGDLFEGAWDSLEKQFKDWGGAAQAQALDVAAEVTSGLSTAEREALSLRQAGDLDQAWDWMKGSLSALGGERLFNPNPTEPGIGEFDPNATVPTGLVRQAIQRAGGSTGISTGPTGQIGNTGQSAFVALRGTDGAPDGGIGTGVLVNEVLSDGGAGIEGYVWVYGPARRKTNFEPHVELDGIEFVNFDDDVLANGDSFPETDFYFPGDHNGCICDFEPVILSAADAGVATEQAVIEEPTQVEVEDFLAGPPAGESPAVAAEDDPFSRMAADILAPPAVSQTAVYDAMGVLAGESEQALATQYGLLSDADQAIVDEFTSRKNYINRTLNQYGKLDSVVGQYADDFDAVMARAGGPEEPVFAYMPVSSVPTIGDSIQYKGYLEPVLDPQYALGGKPNAVMQFVVPKGAPAAFLNETDFVVTRGTNWRVSSWEMVETPRGALPFVRMEYLPPADIIANAGSLGEVLSLPDGIPINRSQMDLLVGPSTTGALPDLELSGRQFSSQAEYEQHLTAEALRSLDTISTQDLKDWYFIQRMGEVDGYKQADGALSMLYKNRGFDALPEVVDPGGIDALKQDGWLELHRGINAGEASDQLIADFREGPYFAGEGVYGNGTYSSTVFDEALGYAGMKEHQVMHLAMSPDARFVEHDLLRNVQQSLTKLLSKWEGMGYDVQLNSALDMETRKEVSRAIIDRATYLRNLIYDEGRLAVAMGYDGIDATSTYKVILNRGATVYERAAWEV